MAKPASKRPPGGSNSVQGGVSHPPAVGKKRSRVPAHDRTDEAVEANCPKKQAGGGKPKKGVLPAAQSGNKAKGKISKG